ncbi:Ribosomal RNA small subunit methyltransferase G [Planctomycetales bacterium 10988]|nr:Ribosomal RNA small subunit methyltransferase G [Planctomycetales bacterium 10988]
MSDEASSPPPDETLVDALDRYSIQLSPEMIDAMDEYRKLLWSWNEKINLTRHTTMDKFVGRDILDSLQFADCLGMDETVLDVGSGGGVPGILLKIMRSDLRVTVLDQTEKKIQVLSKIIKEMKLAMKVERARLQDFLPECQGLSYNTLTFRAVAPIPKVLRWTTGQWGKFNRLLIMKGSNWQKECDEAKDLNLTKRLIIQRVKEFDVPNTEFQSVILEMKPSHRG